MATMLQAAEAEDLAEVESMRCTCQGNTLTLQTDGAPASVFHGVE